MSRRVDPVDMALDILKIILIIIIGAIMIKSLLPLLFS